MRICCIKGNYNMFKYFKNNYDVDLIIRDNIDYLFNRVVYQIIWI